MIESISHHLGVHVDPLSSQLFMQRAHSEGDHEQFHKNATLEAFPQNDVRNSQSKVQTTNPYVSSIIPKALIG